MIHGGTTIEEILAIVEAAELELNNSMCECGARLGDHSQFGRNCPNPADRGPIFLERSFVDVEYSALTMKKADNWVIERGANA